MKTLFFGLLMVFHICVLTSCKDDDTVNGSYCRFLRNELSVPENGGSGSVIVEWSRTEWTISTEPDGFLSDISITDGGGLDVESHMTRVSFTYTSNTKTEPRSQIIYLTNKNTQQRDELLINQVSETPLAYTIDHNKSYQFIEGFGGMYNPAIWLSANDRITETELMKMYGPQGLGYNILRLMIYPKESDWEKDVPGALLAQQHGAIIFACPWDCTDAYSDKVTINGNEYKHLKHEHYQDYTDHLIKYINFMKNKSVNLYAVSVQNEPDMHFTYWYPQEVVDYVKDYGDQIKSTGVKLMAPETCGMHPTYTDLLLNDQAAFNKTDIIAGHLYQGFNDLGSRYDYTVGLYDKYLKNANKGGWWMTEHLFNDGEKEEDSSKWEFWKWSYCMETLAKEIHLSMEGYCSAYVYWYLKRFYGMMGDTDARSQEEPGVILKNGYILSHYAKYAARKTRIEITAEHSVENLFVTAYRSEDSKEVTLIILNMNRLPFTVEFRLQNSVASVSAQSSSESIGMMKDTEVTIENDKNVRTVVDGYGITSIRITL